MASFKQHAAFGFWNVEWITEAKTDETRGRRLAQTLGWMAEGQSRNWKYERRDLGWISRD